MTEINNGVTAAQGFKAAGMHVGVKSNNPNKKDLALIVSERECAAAATFTLNRVKAAPLYETMENLKNGRLRAIVCNSGNANACAPNGRKNARLMCEAAGAALGIAPEDVAVASTGVIGQEINVAVIEKGIPQLVPMLSDEGSDDAANAIMTTDTKKKEIAVSFTLDGKTVKMGGICKGSGMIHPNMGTMLCFITTDAAISPELLQKALSASVKLTYNHVSVDGDTSTNDTCLVLANGMAGNREIIAEGADYEAFYEALHYINTYMARAIAGDGEGATKLLTCKVSGAESFEAAETLAKGIIASSLVKAAMFGSDANWGRVLCAMGYSGAPFDIEAVSVSFKSAAGQVDVCENGEALDFDEDKAKEALSQSEVEILVKAGAGAFFAEAWGCDLTYDYVKINGDYRT